MITFSISAERYGLNNNKAKNFKTDWHENYIDACKEFVKKAFDNEEHFTHKVTIFVSYCCECVDKDEIIPTYAHKCNGYYKIYGEKWSKEKDLDTFHRLINDVLTYGMGAFLEV